MKTVNEDGLPVDVLEESVAISCATSWQENNSLKGFYVPLNDFMKITEDPEAAGARAYVGIKDGVEMLMFVAVDGEGNDLINYEEGKYIYDFTTPCPAMCDENSVLYINEGN